MNKKPLHLLKIFLAKKYARFCKQEMFIGVGGLGGKITTVAACDVVISGKYKTITASWDPDPVLNLSETILKIRPSTQKVIYGISSDNSFIHPKTAIFTDGVTLEESKIIEELPENGLVILNWDDLFCRGLADKCRARVMYFGTDATNCVVSAANIKIENYKTVFELNYKVERVQIKYNLLGEHQIYPALAGASLGISLGIPLTRIKMALESIKPLPHVLNVVTGPNGSILLDDTYDSTGIGVEVSIDTLTKIPAKRRFVVLSEIKDQDSDTEKLHRAIAQKIYKEKIDFVILGAGDTVFVSDELKRLGFWEDRIEQGLANSQIVAKLLTVLGKGDACLIKGIRSTRLDEVVKRIESKN